MKTLLAASLLLFATTATASAQMHEQEFVYNAGVSGAFEIRSSEALLGEDVELQELNEFAQTMIRDHEQAAARLRAVVDSHSLNSPDRLDDKHQRMLFEIERSDDPGETYAQLQVQAHRDAVSLFEQYASDGTNPDLVEYAKETLPTLKQHLEMAMELPGAGSTPRAAE